MNVNLNELLQWLAIVAVWLTLSKAIRYLIKALLGLADIVAEQAGLSVEEVEKLKKDAKL